MHIRQATIHDLDGIMGLYHEAADTMAGTAHDCCWRRDGHPTTDFVRGLAVADGMLVAEQGGTLVGAVGFDHDLGYDYKGVSWLADLPEELVCVVHLLVVRVDQRGKGLSRTLLCALLAQAKERGMRAARLDATANNAPAIALYLSEGFTTVGTGDQDVNPDGEAPIPFVVLERLL